MGNLFKNRKLLFAVAAVLLLSLAAVLFLHEKKPIVIRPDATKKVLAMKKNLGLPSEIDRQTRLDDIKADKEKIIYLMTVLSPREDALNRTGFLRVYLHEQACKSPTYFGLLKEGYTVVVDYRDLDAKELDTVTLEPKECGFPQ